ncbi:MAG TPA: hypothetical protein VFT00_02740, partial [Nocardioides sp.]|nr:hypothetical protein [Nocardioides sp.]
FGFHDSHVAALMAYLQRFYPTDHEVTHYRAAQSVVVEPTIQPIALGELASLPLTVTSTLYVPPLGERDYDLAMATSVGLDGSTAVGSRQRAAADWYRPLSEAPGRLTALLTLLSTNPLLLLAVREDPHPYLVAIGLDPIEAWAFVSRDQAWIHACLREGSGVAAAVAVGAAANEEEAATFFVHPDGRLVRRTPDAPP